MQRFKTIAEMPHLTQAIAEQGAVAPDCVPATQVMQKQAQFARVTAPSTNNALLRHLVKR